MSLTFSAARSSRAKQRICSSDAGSGKWRLHAALSTSLLCADWLIALAAWHAFCNGRCHSVCVRERERVSAWLSASFAAAAASQSQSAHGCCDDLVN